MKEIKSEKVVELEDKLVTAKKVKNYPLCKLLAEAMKKQIESDAALEADDFDSAETLDGYHDPTATERPDVEDPWQKHKA